MRHELTLTRKNGDDSRRLYECANCGRRLRVVAPRLFSNYEARYDKLLEQAADDDCPGPPTVSGTDDGSSCGGA